MLALFTTPLLLVLALTTALLIVLPMGRWRVGVLAGQWLAQTVLMAQLVTGSVVTVRLLTGAGVVLILWLAHPPKPQQPRAFQLPVGSAFRLTAWLLVAVAAWSVAVQPSLALPGLPLGLNLASYLLMGQGLLALGLTEHPLTTGAGLFTALAGFQLFYAAVEPALAIAGLLSAVEFGLALAVGYLAYRHTPPTRPQPQADSE